MSISFRDAVLEHAMLSEAEPEEEVLLEGYWASGRFVRFWETVMPLFPREWITSLPSPCIASFPLVSLYSFWLHDTKKPIIQFDQREVYDLIEGLEWHMFSDVFFVARTSQWLEQCIRLFEHALARALEMCFWKMANPGEINMDTHSTLVPLELSPDISGAKVNFAYLYEMDIQFTHLMIQLYLDRDAFTRDLPGPPMDTQRLKQRAVDYADKLSPKSVVKHRRVFYESLVVTTAQRKIHRIRIENSSRPAAREIIVHKHQLLYEALPECTTALDVIRDRVGGGVSDAIQQRISHDSLLTRLTGSFESIRGDPLAALRAEGFPRITYQRITAQWLVLFEQGTPGLRYPSLMEAFVATRKLRPDLRVKNGIPLDVLDAHL